MNYVSSHKSFSSEAILSSINLVKLDRVLVSMWPSKTFLKLFYYFTTRCLASLRFGNEAETVGKRLGSPYMRPLPEKPQALVRCRHSHLSCTPRFLLQNFENIHATTGRLH